MAVVANQAVAFDKSMLTACRFKPANVPIEERTTGGPHLGDVLRPGLILDHAPLGSDPYRAFTSGLPTTRRHVAM